MPLRTHHRDHPPRQIVHTKEIDLEDAAQGIAGQMMQRILSDARAIGYTAMQLDTEPFLRSALKMYRGLGFYDIPRYTDSPLDTTIFLRLEL